MFFQALHKNNQTVNKIGPKGSSFTLSATFPSKSWMCREDSLQRRQVEGLGSPTLSTSCVQHMEKLIIEELHTKYG